MKPQHLLDDAIHLAVCQSINLDFDDIEEREAEVKQMFQEAIRAALERAWPDRPITPEENNAIQEYVTNLPHELGLEDI